MLFNGKVGWNTNLYAMYTDVQTVCSKYSTL